MIGNTAISTHTTTRDVCPVPNQIEISGTSARIGMACSITMYGNTARSNDLRLAHDDGDRHAQDGGDGQPDEGHAGARPQPAEDLRQVVAVEEADRQHVVRRRAA